MKHLLTLTFLVLSFSSAVAENLKIIKPFGPVEVYDKPSYEGNELAIAQVGEIVELIDDVDIYNSDFYRKQDYVQIKTADGVTGYVFIPALQKIDDPSTLIYSVREGANGKLLSAPSFGSSSELLEILGSGTPVEILEERRAFREVKLLSGQIGWMARNNLEPAAEVNLANNAGDSSDLDASDRINELIIVIEGLNGEYKLQLDWENAPKAAERIVQLTQESKYDDTIFHRYTSGFSIDFGDVQYGNRRNLNLSKLGTGGSTYDNLDRELSTEPILAGSVIMLHGKNGSNSQYGILISDAPFLVGNVTRVGTLKGELSKLIDLGPMIENRRVFIRRIMTPEQYETYEFQEIIRESRNVVLLKRVTALKEIWGKEIIYSDSFPSQGNYGEKRYRLGLDQNADGRDHCQITIGSQERVYRSADDKWLGEYRREWRIDLLEYIDFVLADDERYAFLGGLSGVVNFSYDIGIEITRCETDFAEGVTGAELSCRKRPYLKVGSEMKSPIQDSLFALMLSCRTMFGE